MTAEPTPEEPRSLDAALPPDLRAALEEGHFAPRRERARLEYAQDSGGLDADALARALAPDTGVAWVRGVARRALDTADVLADGFVEPRSPTRMRFVHGYAVLAAYAGGSDPGIAPRRGAVPRTSLVDVGDAVWAANAGSVPWRLMALGADRLQAHPRDVLAQLLALARGVVRASLTGSAAVAFDDPPALAGLARESGSNGAARDRLAWLASDDENLQALRDDVVDALRAVCCALALRTRGVNERTVGGYHVLVDHASGDALYALLIDERRQYMVRARAASAGGRANLSAARLTARGELHLAIQRGEFADEAAANRAARAFAGVVADVYGRVAGSLPAKPPPGASRAGRDGLRLAIERPPDDGAFAELVTAALELVAPDLLPRLAIVPSLANAHWRERRRYERAEPVSWNEATRSELLANIARTGHSTAAVDGESAFENVRVIELEEGEILVEAGAPSSFAYVPLGSGLIGVATGDWDPFAVAPWILIGAHGIVSAAPRSATITARREVALLGIPADTYRSAWHCPYEHDGLLARLAGDDQGRAPSSL